MRVIPWEVIEKSQSELGEDGNAWCGTFWWRLDIRDSRPERRRGRCSQLWGHDGFRAHTTRFPVGGCSSWGALSLELQSVCTLAPIVGSDMGDDGWSHDLCFIRGCQALGRQGGPDKPEDVERLVEQDVSQGDGMEAEEEGGIVNDDPADRAPV